MEKIIIWGAGNICKEYLRKEKFHNFNIICLVDNDERKWGTELEGIKIKNPDALSNIQFDKILILANAFEEIKTQILQTYHIDNQMIMSFRELWDIPRDCNMGDIEFLEEIQTGNYVDMNYLCKNNLIVVKNDLEHFFFYEKHNPISKWFHYFEIYHSFFEKFRDKRIKVLEIGVYKGGSLQMWKQYFGEKAQIIGIDIDENCSLYQDEGIDVLIGSQNDVVFLEKVKRSYGEFDVVIDDGSHKMEHQITAFECLFPSVRQGGIYLCEDTHTSYWKDWGGSYKGNDTYIEYAKNFIDDLHISHIETKSYIPGSNAREFKSIHFFDSVVVIEKKKCGVPFSGIIGNTESLKSK